MKMHLAYYEYSAGGMSISYDKNCLFIKSKMGLCYRSEKVNPQSIVGQKKYEVLLDLKDIIAYVKKGSIELYSDFCP